MKQHSRKLTPYLIIVLACSVIALAFFSNWYDRYDSATYRESGLQLAGFTNADPTNTGLAISDQGIVIPESGGTIVLDHVDQATQTLKITATADKPLLVSGHASIQDSSNAPGVSYADDFALEAHGRQNSDTIRFRSTGPVKQLQITFNGAGTSFTVTGVTLNPTYRFSVNYAMWVLMVACASLAYTIYAKRWYAVVFDRTKRAHNLAIWLDCLLCIGVSLAILFWVYRPAALTTPYPSASTDQYVLQFDAWKHGSLPLLQNPPDALLALDNPYSAAAHQQVQGGLYDVVLFNGRYYSYFGVVPLLLLYVPFNVLFPNKLPSDILVTSVLAVATIAAVTLLIRELVIFFRHEVNLLLMLCAIPAVVSGGLVFYLQSNSAVYYIPLLSAMLFGVLSIACGFRAARASHPAMQVAMFALSGLSLALQLGSRPNSTIGTVMFLLPLYVSILFNGKTGIGSRILKALSFAVPAVLGLCAQLWYNRARFGSMLNFGNDLQITNDDLRDNVLTFDPVKLKDMLLNFFLLPFKLDAEFPFVSYQGSVVSGYGNYFYQHYMFGIMMMPIAWFIVLIAKRGYTSLERWTMCSGLLGCLIVAYVNYSIAGSIFRYYCDFILPFLAIAAIAMLQNVHPRHGRHEAQDGQISLYVPAVALCTVTTLLGLLLVFSDHPEAWTMVRSVNPDLYVTFLNTFDVA